MNLLFSNRQIVAKLFALAVSLACPVPTECMYEYNFGTIDNLIEDDKEAYRLYNLESQKASLVLAQRPFERDAYCKELAERATPKLEAWQKGVAKIVSPENETNPASPTGQAARIAELEEQLKLAIPKGLFDMMNESAVVSSARLLFYRSDSRIDLKPSFRVLARQITAHCLFAADETQKQVTQKKEETLKERFKTEKTEWETKIQGKDTEVKNAEKSIEDKNAKLAALVKICTELETKEAEESAKANKLREESARHRKERLSLERQAEENAQLRKQLSPLRRQEQEQDEQIQELQKQLEEMHNKLTATTQKNV